jgi:hypothetical protein
MHPVITLIQEQGENILQILVRVACMCCRELSATINGVFGPSGLRVLHETKSPLLMMFFSLPFSPSVTFLPELISVGF